VTSKAAKDITPKEAESHILGYTIGNDLSRRFFQLPDNSGGQFYFAKAFDNFAPIGPVLVSPLHFNEGASARRLTTKVNGKLVQDTVIADDMIFSPALILSQMSQGLWILIDAVTIAQIADASFNRDYHSSRHSSHDRNTGWRGRFSKPEVISGARRRDRDRAQWSWHFAQYCPIRRVSRVPGVLWYSVSQHAFL